MQLTITLLHTINSKIYHLLLVGFCIATNILMEWLAFHKHLFDLIDHFQQQLMCQPYFESDQKKNNLEERIGFNVKFAYQITCL